MPFLQIRAVANSAPELFSVANVSISIQDSNEFAPFFPFPVYTVVVNSPEVTQIGDTISQVRAVDYDANGLTGLTYAVVGPYADRFVADTYGQIRLRRVFDVINDAQYEYNVTIMADDEQGRSGFASLIVYLNMTAALPMRAAPFTCLLDAAISELDRDGDNWTLTPPLYAQARSPYAVRYALAESQPALGDSLVINENSGQITLRAPLNQFILNNYDR